MDKDFIAYNIARQQEYLDALDIKVLLVDNIESGVTFIYENKRYIMVNKNLDEVKRYWVIEHELSHNLLDNLYDASTSADLIKQIEKETNEDMLFSNKLINLMILNIGMAKNGYPMPKEKFCEYFKVTPEVYDMANKYVNFELIKKIKELMEVEK